MTLPDLIAALREAVNPRRPRNRRRLTSPRAQRCVNLLARTCAIIRAMPAACQKLRRRIFPPKPAKYELVCGCGHPNHPSHRNHERDWPKFKHRPKGGRKRKLRH